mmetsp:Transcript_27050/g.62530  ORF Transcript_27050/g.62530 Transcript_27050/m.62530 type:complete len:457 (+) Transcript_27050:65-1435(+)
MVGHWISVAAALAWLSAGEAAVASLQGFQGTWLEEQNRYSWNQDEDYFITWEAPPLSSAAAPRARAGFNMSATEAVLASGPLSVLYALTVCETHGALGKLLRKAYKTRSLNLHVIGVNTSLEPAMDWDKLLVGPVPHELHPILEAYGLPRAPFKGMKVHVLFSYSGRSNDIHLTARQRGPFTRGYSEEFVEGLYHMAVAETPDLVVAINPGFAHYPAAWWPTLRKLHASDTPIVATGYSNSFRDGVNRGSAGPVYKMLASTGMTVPPSKAKPCTSLRGCLQQTLEPREKLAAIELHSVAQLAPAGSGNADSEPTRSTDPLPTQCLAKPLQSVKVDTVCADLDGNALIADRAGFAVRLSSRQPFFYCDAPAQGLCSSSAAISVFEPRADALEVEHEQVPTSLVRDDLMKMVDCHTHKKPSSPHCLKQYIVALSSNYLTEQPLITEVLNRAVQACNSE